MERRTKVQPTDGVTLKKCTDKIEHFKGTAAAGSVGDKDAEGPRAGARRPGIFFGLVPLEVAELDSTDFGLV